MKHNTNSGIVKTLKKPTQMALNVAIATALFAGYGSRKVFAGSCSGAAGTYSCTGVANSATDTHQNITSTTNNLNVTTDVNFGIHVTNNSAITLSVSPAASDISFTDANNSDIHGYYEGLKVNNNSLNGNTTITSNGTISSDTNNAVDINIGDNINFVPAGTTTLSINNAIGIDNGIKASIYASGNTTITTSGTIRGATNHGIYALNYYYLSGDLTVNNSGNIEAYKNGINAINAGYGNLIITNSGPITAPLNVSKIQNTKEKSNLQIVNGNSYCNNFLIGNNGYDEGVAISGCNLSTNNSNLTIESGPAAISGALIGIQAFNYNGNSTQITTTGPINSNGFGVFNFSGTSENTNITIGGEVNAGVAGVVSSNYYGSSSSSNSTIITNSPINAIYGIAVFGQNTTTITSNSSLNSNAAGIFTRSYGPDATTTINSNGNINTLGNGMSGNYYTGSGINTFSAFDDLTINLEGTINASFNGISSMHAVGTTSNITINNTITAGVNGVFIGNYSYGPSKVSSYPKLEIINTNKTNLFKNKASSPIKKLISKGNVAGPNHITINANSPISGESSGITAISNTDFYNPYSPDLSGSTITINSSSAINSMNGTAITTSTNESDLTTITLNSGSNINGDIENLQGRTVIISNTGSSISGEIRLGNSSDSLEFSAGDSSSVSLFDGGTDPQPTKGGPVFDSSSDTLTFSSSSRSFNNDILLNWETINSLSGSTLNFFGSRLITTNTFNIVASTVSMANNTAGDTLIIEAELTGGGRFEIDTVLNDENSLTDVLSFSGTTSGNHTVFVNNIGGLGEPTRGDGILVIQGGVNSNTTFTLESPVSVNGVEYFLVNPEFSNNWYLQTNPAQVDLAITKNLVTQAPYIVGDTLTYEIQITNNGMDTAKQVTVTDTMTNLSLQSFSSTNCLPASFPCTIATLANGQTETITLTTTIDSEGSFDNSAFVSSDVADQDTADNQDITGNGGFATLPVNDVDLTITKDLLSMGPFLVGDTVTYEINVSNSGPDEATGVVVSDTMTNLTLQSMTSPLCTPASFPCSISSLPNGLTETITVTATINSAGLFDNSASVSSVDSEQNPNDNIDAVGNSGMATDPIPEVNLSINKELTTVEPYLVGDTVTYEIIINNSGPETASNVIVSDTMTNLTLQSMTSTNCIPASFPCTISSLAVGSSETITITASINSSGVFDNSASVSSNDFDQNASDNIDNRGNGGMAINPEPEIIPSLNAVNKSLLAILLSGFAFFQFKRRKKNI